jgi:hypothetical protein
MRCPVHVSQEMVPIAFESEKTLRLRRPGEGLALEELEQRAKNIVLVKCPLSSCWRVDVVVNILERTKKLCPGCGRVSDAPGYRAMIGDHRCVECRNRNLKLWARRRRAERKRAGVWLSSTRRLRGE